MAAPPAVVVDCSTGQARPVVLTPAEQTDYDTRLAAAPGIAAAQAAAAANARILNTNIAGALARLRQIAGANPNTVTLPQVAQAVSDIATDVLFLARIVSQQFDGTS